MIAASAVFAAVEAIDRLRHPAPLDHVWVVLGAGVIGFLGQRGGVDLSHPRGQGDRLGGARRRRTSRANRRLDVARGRGRRDRRARRLPALRRDRRPAHHGGDRLHARVGRAHGAPPRARRDRRADDAPDRGGRRRRSPVWSTSRRRRRAGWGTSSAPSWRSTSRRTSPSRPDTTSPSASERRSCTTFRGSGTRWSTSTRTSTIRICRPEPVPSLTAAARTMAVHMDESTLPPPPPTGVPEFCYRHPNVETGVHCTRCGRPICPECMIPAPGRPPVPRLRQRGPARVPQGSRDGGSPRRTSGGGRRPPRSCWW